MELLAAGALRLHVEREEKDAVRVTLEAKRLLVRTKLPVGAVGARGWLRPRNQLRQVLSRC